MGQIASAASELNPEEETVVICHHGIRSRSVAHYLERIGFTNVINLQGGVEAWARDVDPHMQTY
jgi:rhodanese-related sulfurtransferase